MSYDLTLFATVPGEDPDDTIGELLESFDEELPADQAAGVAAKVRALVAALQREFPDAEVDARRDGTHALLSIEEGALTVDVFFDHCDICISYAQPHDEAWFLDRVGRVAAATTAGAGLRDLYDMQLGQVVNLADGAAAINAGFEQGEAVLEDLADEYGAATRRRGVIRRLFGRR